jgi:uncharacterized protein (DUF302 family)
MTYHFSQTLNCTFDEAIALVTGALQAEGMGILTEIDAQAAFKKKLNVDFRRYKILGACHPQIAYRMLQTDDKAGVLYPCNIVVQEHENDKIEVSAVDPKMMFLAITDPRAQTIASEGSQIMQAVMHRLQQNVSVAA